MFGILADYLGRVRVLTWTILLFAVFTGLCAFAQGYWDLLVYRTIAGLGLGGEFGIGMALVAEAWPAHSGRAPVSYVGLGWQAGVLRAALRHAAAAAGDRLARHVRRRARAGARLVRWCAASVGEPKIFVEREGAKPRAHGAARACW